MVPLWQLGEKCLAKFFACLLAYLRLVGDCFLSLLAPAFLQSQSKTTVREKGENVSIGKLMEQVGFSTKDDSRD